METKSGDRREEVAEIFRRIRSRLALNSGSVTEESRIPSPAPDTTELITLRNLLVALETAYAQVGVPNVRPPGVRNKIVQLVKRIMARALSWYTRPLRQYQAVTNQLMRETIQVLEIQQAELKAVREELGRVLATGKVVQNEKPEDRLPLEGTATKTDR